MKILGNAAVFTIIYFLLMGPTYFLPYIGSNSSVVMAMHGAAEAADIPGMNIAFWAHLFALIGLVVITWFRGALIDKSWLIIFPIIATVFDLAPVISSIPLIPTIMHLLAIILGVTGVQAVVPATQESS